MESVRALRDNSFAGLIVLGHKIYNPSIIIVISIVIFSSITILIMLILTIIQKVLTSWSFLGSNGLCHNMTRVVNCQYNVTGKWKMPQKNDLQQNWSIIETPFLQGALSDCSDKRNCITLEGMYQCDGGNCTTIEWPYNCTRWLWRWANFYSGRFGFSSLHLFLSPPK